MVINIQTDKLNKYSLSFLFQNYKVSKDDKVLGEIFKRTSSKTYDIITSKVGYRDNPSSIVLMVYGMMKEMLDNNDPKMDVENYLEQIVDGCIIIYSY